MDAGSSSASSSSQRVTPSNSIHERSTSTVKHEFTSQTFELSPLPSPDLETAPAHPRRSSWKSRSKARLKANFPRLYRSLRRCALFIRGPRPMIELPEPAPWFDIDRTFRGKRYYLPLESNLIRLTRPLTYGWLFIILAVAYIISLAFMSKAQSFDTPASSFIDCTSTYWLANDGCGLDGDSCGPFTDDLTFDFRCPAQCGSLILQNPRAVGNEQIAFKPLIVGGGDPEETYRGDSFICASAIQAGLIDDAKGGCASLQLVSNFTDFLPRDAHGLRSIGFPTIFPIGFRFSPSTSLTHCEDIRNPALAFNVAITCILFFFLRPKPIVLFWCLVCIGYWHITLFSQPRASPPPIDDAFGSFLPALFICYAFWKVAFRFTLPGFVKKAPYEGAIWYLGPFWVGVLSNLTFDKIPISTLTASDIKQRAGGIASLVIIVVVVAAIALNQALMIRKTGWLPYYLKWYISAALVIVVISQLPGLQLRLHHYIIAIFLMPGTGFPTRLSAVYQGFLLGLFLNGVAAFGLDSILQTAADLRQDGTIGSDLAHFVTNSTNYNTSIPFANQSISWDPLPDGWDGFVLLVDDVERFAGTATDFALSSLNSSLPHFFRLALSSSGETGDFTKAATLWPNGTWVGPRPGPT